MATPGVVLVVSAHEPVTVTRALGEQPIVIGRDARCDLSIDDAELSRRHCEVALLGDGRYRVTDLGSQNGTRVNGRPVNAREGVVEAAPAIVRVGGSIVVLERDVDTFAAGVRVEDDVVGPVLRVAYDAIERAAREGRHLFVDGENGTGKERAARLFHAVGGNATGRFLPINCATPDAARSFDEARGGVVFLDQLDALDPDAQRTVLDRAEAVPGALVVATAAPRCDAYVRVVLPPVRDRRAEIPFLVAHALRETELETTASLIEECLLRRWPANVRELVGAVGAAARMAQSAGAERVSAKDLPAWAGIDGERSGASTMPDLARLGLPIVNAR